MLTSSCNCFSLLQDSTAFFKRIKLSISVGFTLNSVKWLFNLSIVCFTFVIKTLGITFLIFSIHTFGAFETLSNKSSNWNSNIPIFKDGFIARIILSFSWNSTNKSFNSVGVAVCSNSLKLILLFFK